MSHRLRLPLYRTQFLITWERAYAAFMPAAALFVGFVGISLLGVWDALDPKFHALGLALFVLAMGLLLRRGMKRYATPTLEDVQSRLETDSRLAPGTLRDLVDQPAIGDSDSPFWQAHLARLHRQARAAKPGRPRALIDETDPFSLRFLALLLLSAGFIFAGDKVTDRLTSSFSPNWQKNVVLTADVWIEPPTYTQQPAKFLVRSGAIPDQTHPMIEVPAGSSLNVRMTQADGETPRAKSKIATGNGQQPLDMSESNGSRILTYTIEQNMAFSLKAVGAESIWPIKAIEDMPPAVAWIGDPETEGGTRTLIPVNVDDDYGIAEAAIILTLVKDQQRPPDTPPLSDENSSNLSVELPALRGTSGDRQVSVDLTEHPWAGLDVDMVIQVRDGAGAIAQTDVRRFTLPERTFYNPLARTIIQERRNLALVPQSWRRTARLLDALTFAPEFFSENAQEYLLMRTAFHEVNRGQGQNAEEIVESFWPLAVALEDEGLTLARQRLDAAKQALREALARNAPQEEIDRLVEELRQAMNDYVAALAASGDAFSSDTDGEADLSGRDLDDILDEIAELRRQGDSEEARQRLAELEQLLENLSIAQGGGSGEGQGTGQGANGQGQSADGEGAGEGEGEGRPLDQAGDLIDQQRRLADDTYGARRGDRGTDGLSQSQADLANAARTLSAQAEELNEGVGPNSAEAFSNAADAMQRAAGALARGDLEEAQSLQEQALLSLQQGGEALAAQTRAQERQTEDGQASTEGQNGVADNQGADRDPLGRVYGGQSDTGIEIPDLSSPERIRELTDELRSRLSDPNLPEQEREYLERLLERF